MVAKGEATIVTATRDRLGEGVLWHPGEQALYWIDFFGPTIHRLAEGTPVETYPLAKGKTIGALAFHEGGGLVVALDHGLHLFDRREGTLTIFADPNEGRDGVSYNDAKVDPAGRLWVGTYDVKESEPRGVLYRMDGRRATLADSGFIVCNGPGFSADGERLYMSDTAGRRLIAYRVEAETGRLVERQLFVDLSGHDGMPDGLAVDCAGNVWCALYGAAQVIRFTPRGTVDRVITLPVRNVASCCLGGENMATLFVTSGEDPMSPADRGIDGALFAVPVDIRGNPEPLFRTGPDGVV